MSERAQTLDNLKQMLRSYLLSVPNGMSLSKIGRDFYNFMGMNIPYRELGYSNLIDLFEAIPDAARMVRRSDDTYVEGVANEQTEHIAEMISKQKKNTSGYPKRNSNKKRNLHSYALPPRMQQISAGTRMVYHHLDISLPKCVPPRLKQNIGELLSSYPEGLKMDNFKLAFQRAYGICINHQDYNYARLEDFIRSLASEGIVKIHGTSDSYVIFSPKARNINSPVQNNKTDCQHASPENDCIEHNSNWEDGVYINQQVLEKLRKVLERFPLGILMTQLSDFYKEVTGSVLDPEELGFNNIPELVDNLKDIFRIRINSTGDWLLIDARLPPDPEPEPDTSGRQMYERLDLPDDIKQNLYDLIKHSTDGILLSQFESTYEMNFSSKIPWIELKHQSLESMLSTLDFIPPIRFERSGLNDLKVKLTPYDEISGHIAENVALPNNENMIPKDAVLLGQVYTPLKVPYDLGPDDYFPVLVSVVESPGKIWLQLICPVEKRNVEFDELMDNLEDFYQSPEAEHYKMPEKYLVKSMLCAVIYPDDQNWHRGCIIGKPGPTQYEVFYYDYGTICVVEKDLIRLLKKPFAVLPAQAFCARLAKVQPMETFFSRESTSRLLELCLNKPLMAQITDRIYMGTISVILCDTSADTDVFINDCLLRERLVEQCSDTVECRMPVPGSADVSHTTAQTSWNTVQDQNLMSPTMNNLSPLSPNLPSLNNPLTAQVPRQFGPPPGLTKSASNMFPILPLGARLYSPGSQVFEPPNVSNVFQERQHSLVLDPEVLKRMEAKKKLLNFSPKDGANLPQATVEPIQHSMAPKEPEMLVPLTPARNPEPSVQAVQHIMAHASGSHSQQPDEMYESSTENDAQGDEVTSAGDQNQVRFCKKICFREAEYRAHLINFYGRPCFTSADVSSFIFGVDILKKMLKIQKYPPCHIIASREEHRDLFEELEKECVTGFTNEDAKTDKVTMYYLSDVVKILEFLKHNKQTLVEDIEEFNNNFDAKDSYWTTKVELEDHRLPQKREEIEAKLRDLREEKKSLFQCMMDLDISHVSEAERLVVVDKEIDKLKKQLARHDEVHHKSAVEQAKEFLERFKLNSHQTESSVDIDMCSTQSPLEVVTAVSTTTAQVMQPVNVPNPVPTPLANPVYFVPRPPVANQVLPQTIMASPFNPLLSVNIPHQYMCRATYGFPPVNTHFSAAPSNPPPAAAPSYNGIRHQGHLNWSWQ